MCVEGVYLQLRSKVKDYTCRLACQRSIVYGRGFALLRRMVKSFLTEFDVFIIGGKNVGKSV